MLLVLVVLMFLVLLFSVLVTGQPSFLARRRRRGPGRAGRGDRAGRLFGNEDVVSHRQVRGHVAVEDEHRLDHPHLHRDRCPRSARRSVWGASCRNSASARVTATEIMTPRSCA
jgi:hypothetical protein